MRLLPGTAFLLGIALTACSGGGSGATDTAIDEGQDPAADSTYDPASDPAPDPPVDTSGEDPGTDAVEQPPMGDDASIVYLHHSTGQNVWNGGVPEWFDSYNTANGTTYSITEVAFPSAAGYGWNNYPYDYWNIWVAHAGTDPYLTEPTLEILAPQYDVIVFKHCFPVSGIGEDTGSPDVASDAKTIENYRLQYAALREKLLGFPENRFVVWTGAALTADSTTTDQARRSRDFFEWVKLEWDVPGDNIYVWDFFELETGGGDTMIVDHAASSGDSHPNEAFSAEVAPLLGARVVNVIRGLGDTTSLTGE